MDEPTRELQSIVENLQSQISDLKEQLKELRSIFNYHRHYKDTGSPDSFVSEPVS